MVNSEAGPKRPITTKRNRILNSFSKADSITSKIIPKSSGCWEWSGNKDTCGYGAFKMHRGQQVRAHRFVMAVIHGYIPNYRHLEICHKCDNPACCNPDHLFLGTHLENMRDSSQKGRARSARGIIHHSNKLTEQQVIQLRNMRREKRTQWTTLGRIFGITAANARKTCLGLKWSWLQPETFAK